MTIHFIIDDFNLARQDGVIVTDPALIPDIRRQIHDNLAHAPETPLNICVSSVLFRRFQDLEGAQGITVERLSPFHELRALLGETPPEWLNESLAAALCRQPALPPHTPDNVAAKVLALIQPDLALPADVQAFYQALWAQAGMMNEVLAVEAVQAYLRTVLAAFMPAETAARFLSGLADTTEIPRWLDTLAAEQRREKLRQVIEQQALVMDFPLPPRRFEVALLNALPMLPLPEARAGDLPGQLCHVLEQIERQCRMGTCEAEVLAAAVFVDWPVVLNLLAQLLQDNPDIANEALRDALRALPAAQARQLAARIEDCLQFTPCEPLAASADVESALAWSGRYFGYALREFQRGREPAEAVSGSFTQWLLAQQPRIMRSDADWRTVAARVARYLAEERVVLLCMIDALGAIHTDTLTTLLHEKLADTSLETETLFAPLPTLTETAKVAVLTGKPAHEISADYATALRQAYAAWLDKPGALQIIKNWQAAANEHLQADTRLLVFFENRLDDHLHSGVDFAKHQEAIQPVLRQLARNIKDWFKDALQFRKQAVVLITADHGVTAIEEAAHDPLAKAGRRAVPINVAEADNLPADWFFLAAGENRGYAVPLKRVRLNENRLTHGGLTPEEVLIPLVTVSRELLQTVQTAVVLRATGRCQALERGWFVTLAVMPTVRMEKLRLQVQAPFQADIPTYSELAPHHETRIEFYLESAIEQSGQVAVRFAVSYQTGDNRQWQQLETVLNLELGAHLLERNADAEAFDHMFD